jgi:CheY-like chemotaxis protein
MMPGRRGDEVRKKIEEDPGRDGINDGTPIIALTANVSGGLRDKYIDEYGFDDYLSKPFKFADLAEVISKYVEEIPE